MAPGGELAPSWDRALLPSWLSSTALAAPSLAIADTFIVRAPALPLRAVAACRNLATWFDDPFVQDALFLAAPALLAEARRWRRGELSARDTGRMERALLKYALRMATRATPFGLFATCSVGRFGDTTRGELGPRDSIRRHARLDMELAFRLADRLTADPQVRSRLRFVPNSTIYSVAGDVRMYEHWHDASGHRHYRLVAIEGNPYLAKVLVAARDGATLDALAAATADADVPLADARQYASGLVDNQVLVSELEPSLTDPAFLDTMIAVTGNERLAQARTALEAGAYAEVHAAVTPLVPEARAEALFQLDAFRPGALALAAHLRDDLLAGLAFLARVAPAAPGRMAAFHASFRERFGDREVPLLLALDSDIGVPHGQHTTAVAPLLEGLDDLGKPPSPAPAEPVATAIEERLHPLVQRAIADGLEELDLATLDLSGAFQDAGGDASSFTAYCMAAAIGGTLRMAVLGAGGCSATASIGRFAHLDPAIDAHAKAIAAHEAAAHAGRVVAELLHLPEDRHGNVLLHPAFRAHEIPCLARSSVDAAFQVRLDDLRLSAGPAGSIRLRSTSRGCEVVPIISNAHRFTAPELLPIYRLLGDLQIGRELYLPTAWLLRQTGHLPRLTLGRCVLTPARWHFAGAAFEGLVRNLTESLPAFDAWRDGAGLPAAVRLVSQDGESTLFLELTDGNCLDLLAVELRGRSECTFVEDLFTGDGQWLNGDDGAYGHEIVVAVLATS